MTTYDFVHIVIHAAGDRIEGRTKLQKVVYFAGVLTGELQKLGYRPHYYGPYSSAVADAVQELRGLKFLEQHAQSEGATDESGFEMTRYDYALTPEGKAVAEEKAARWPDVWGRIGEAMGRLKGANVQDYVRLAIAAKAHLLSQAAGQVLPADALRQKAAEHGWKAFTDEQYAEAVRFLAAVVGPPPSAH